MSDDTTTQDRHKGIQIGERIRTISDWRTFGNFISAGTEAEVTDLLAQGCFAVRFDDGSKGMMPAVHVEKAGGPL